ncbi:MAG: TldD/PmbA family protein [Candidatus Verstraetearchaeota archaeon]|nr:TldD/PmbA family protein [Candidatus Verstraetearchaeota archaeon]
MKGKLFEIGDRVLAGFLASKADHAIVLPSQAERLMVRFSNNRITVVQNWETTGIDVLAVFGRKAVITRFEDVSEEGIRKGIERAVKTVPMLAESDAANEPEGTKYPDRTTSETIDPERINDCVRCGITAALSEGAERCAGVFTAEVRRTGLITSAGGEGYDERAAFELNIRAFSGDGSGQGLTCRSNMGGLDPEKAGRDAGRIAHMSREAGQWSEGEYDLLLGPIILANLLERVGDASSAFIVEAGVSFLAGKVGQQVFSEGLTIEDDGTDPEGISSRSFDDEGIPTRKNLIVDSGKLVGYLHNKATAKRAGTSSTGNAGWLSPSPWNLKIAPGDISTEEMIGEMRRGVYIVSNWYTRFQNYSTGDFSTICRDGAFLVERGEIKYALRGVRISDNLPRILSSVKRIGAERSWIHWWEVRTPALVPPVEVAGAKLTKAQES